MDCFVSLELVFFVKRVKKIHSLVVRVREACDKNMKFMVCDYTYLHSKKNEIV